MLVSDELYINYLSIMYSTHEKNLNSFWVVPILAIFTLRLPPLLPMSIKRTANHWKRWFLVYGFKLIHDKADLVFVYA